MAVESESFLRAGDRVKVKTGPLAGQTGVVEECQPARVCRVRMADGTVRYFSAVQLAVFLGTADSVPSAVKKMSSRQPSRN